MYINFHVKVPLLLSDFNEIWTFWTHFRKILKYQISLKCNHWDPSCSMRTDGQTDLTKLIAAFSQSCEKAANRYSWNCRIWISPAGVWDNWGHRECGAVWQAELFPASSQRVKQSNKHFKHQAVREEVFLDCSTLKYESTTNSRNVWKGTHKHTGSYHRVPKPCSMHISAKIG